MRAAARPTTTPTMPTEPATDVATPKDSDAPRRWPSVEHIGPALTLGYLALIVIGMFHNYVRYRRFGINILDFAEPSDFLLAPLGDPLVMVATVVPIVVIHWYLKGSERLGEQLRMKRRLAGKPVVWWETKEENIARTKRWMLSIRWLTMLLWVLASGLWYERLASVRIMLGHGTQVVVETTATVKEEGTASRPLMLIGTTTRYLFLFRTADWRTVILPTENILRIVPVAQAMGSKTVRPTLIRAMDSTVRAVP